MVPTEPLPESTPALEVCSFNDSLLTPVEEEEDGVAVVVLSLVNILHHPVAGGRAPRDFLLLELVVEEEGVACVW